MADYKSDLEKNRVREQDITNFTQPLVPTDVETLLNLYHAGTGVDFGLPLNDAYGNYLDQAFRSTGAGGFYNQLQTFLTCIDRYQRNVMPGAAEHSGYTFITRPKLCLVSPNLRQNRAMSPLDTLAPNSMPLAIRMLLDTKFTADHMDLAKQCALIEPRNPFMVPLMNALQSISNFPDFVQETETTAGGFHSEDQTYAIGSAVFQKTQELQLLFKDVVYNPISAILYYWSEYIASVAKGTMLAYGEDIDAQRMCYTVSIYRFCVDPTKRYVTHFGKATGCFPRSHPTGGFLNVDENEIFVTAAQRFSTAFVANKVEIMDPAILVDFNLLVSRFCPEIESLPTLQALPENNFRGLPYIDIKGAHTEIVFKDITPLLSKEEKAKYNFDLEDYPEEWKQKAAALDRLLKGERSLEQVAARDYYANQQSQFSNMT